MHLKLGTDVDHQIGMTTHDGVAKRSKVVTTSDNVFR